MQHSIHTTHHLFHGELTDAPGGNEVWDDYWRSVASSLSGRGMQTPCDPDIQYGAGTDVGNLARFVPSELHSGRANVNAYKG